MLCQVTWYCKAQPRQTFFSLPNFINIDIIATSYTVLLATVKDNSMADFQYEPLLGSDSIRLLLLQPSSPLSDIHCRLLHTSLADCNDEIIDQYTALSYVWGDPESQKRVFVNEQTVHITLNLFHALRDLRDSQRFTNITSSIGCLCRQYDN
jgi:Heterokaryon incompatibility protein (HET)